MRSLQGAGERVKTRVRTGTLETVPWKTKNGWGIESRKRRGLQYVFRPLPGFAYFKNRDSKALAPALYPASSLLHSV